MQMALKIWRYDSATGDRALKEYEFDAPEWATLLDCLDIVKDKHDGSLAFRKSCRMMICGSCGMRMDGAAVLACKTRMYDISQERMNVVHKESLCINCGCCVSECNAMESDPEFLGPQALAKGMRFVGDPRDGEKVQRLEEYSGQHGIWECTRCFFCTERCPKGVDPRDAIAKLGAEAIKEGIDRDMGAKHAKWFIRSSETTGWLRETELVPKTQGIVSSVKQMKFAMNLIKHNKAGLAFPPHVAADVGEARALHKLVHAQGRLGYEGHVQGEHALAKLEHGYKEGRDPYGPGSFPRPYLPAEEGAA